MRRAELDRLNVFAWRRGYMIRRSGSKYAVIHKPDLARLWADGAGKSDVQTAVKVTDRLFTSGDAAALRRWIEDASDNTEDTR